VVDVPLTFGAGMATGEAVFDRHVLTPGIGLGWRGLIHHFTADNSAEASSRPEARNVAA
jgi:hypothetical protein